MASLRARSSSPESSTTGTSGGGSRSRGESTSSSSSSSASSISTSSSSSEEEEDPDSNTSSLSSSPHTTPLGGGGSEGAVTIATAFEPPKTDANGPRRLSLEAEEGHSPRLTSPTSAGGLAHASVSIFGHVSSSGTLLRSAASRKSLLKSASSASLHQPRAEEANRIPDDEGAAASSARVAKDIDEAREAESDDEEGVDVVDESNFGTKFDFHPKVSAPSTTIEDVVAVSKDEPNQPNDEPHHSIPSEGASIEETTSAGGDERSGSGELATSEEAKQSLESLAAAGENATFRRTSARTAALTAARAKGRSGDRSKLAVDVSGADPAEYADDARLSPGMGANGGNRKSSAANAQVVDAIVNRPNNVTGEWPRVGEEYQADIPVWDPACVDSRPTSSDTELLTFPPDEAVSGGETEVVPVKSESADVPAASEPTAVEAASAEPETVNGVEEVPVTRDASSLPGSEPNGATPPIPAPAPRRPFPKIPYVESILPMEARANPVVREWTPLEISEFARALYKDNDDFARIARTMNNRKTLNQLPGWVPETPRRCANYFFTVFFSSPSFKPWQQAAMRKEHRRTPIEFRSEDGGNYNSTSAYDSLLDIGPDSDGEGGLAARDAGKRPRRNVSRVLTGWGVTGATSAKSAADAAKGSKKRGRRHEDNGNLDGAKRRHHSHKHGRDHEDKARGAQAKSNKKGSDDAASASGSGQEPHEERTWEDPRNEYIPSKISEIPTLEDMRPLKTSACVCGRGSPSVLFIECGTCGAWLHAACMGLRKEMIDQDSMLRCEKCAKVGKALGIPGPELEHPTTWSVKHNRGEASRLVIVPLTNTTRARLSVIPPQATEDMPHSKIWEQCAQETQADYGGTAGRAAWASQPNVAEMENALLPVGVPSYVTDPPFNDSRDYVLLLASRRVPVWDRANGVLIAGARAPRVCELAAYLKANPMHITYHGVVKRNPNTNLRGGVVQEVQDPSMGLAHLPQQMYPPAAQMEAEMNAARMQQIQQHYAQQQHYLQQQHQQHQHLQQQHMFAIAQLQNEVQQQHQALLGLQQELQAAQAYYPYMNPQQHFQFQQQQQIFQQRQQMYAASQSRLQQLQQTSFSAPSFSDAYTGFVQQQTAYESELAVYESHANADLQQRVANLISECQETMAQLEARGREHPEQAAEVGRLLNEHNNQLNNEVTNLRAGFDETIKLRRAQFQAVLEQQQQQLMHMYPEQMTAMMQHQYEMQQQQMMLHKQQMEQHQFQQQQQQQQQFASSQEGAEQQQQAQKQLQPGAEQSSGGAPAPSNELSSPTRTPEEESRRALEVEYIRQLDNLTFQNIVLHNQYNFHSKHFGSASADLQEDDMEREFKESINILVMHAYRIHAKFLKDVGLLEPQIEDALKGHVGPAPLLLELQPTFPAPAGEAPVAAGAEKSVVVKTETGESTGASSAPPEKSEIPSKAATAIEGV